VGGGGGGAGSAGTSGAAGSGTANSITGSSLTYCAGAYVDANPVSSYGGGGGGRNGTGQTGQTGVVVISYPGGQQATGGTITTSGGNTIHTFTASGTFTVL
jgi:hypothetical protein